MLGDFLFITSLCFVVAMGKLMQPNSSILDSLRSKDQFGCGTRRKLQKCSLWLQVAVPPTSSPKHVPRELDFLLPRVTTLSLLMKKETGSSTWELLFSCSTDFDIIQLIDGYYSNKEHIVLQLMRLGFLCTMPAPFYMRLPGVHWSLLWGTIIDGIEISIWVLGDKTLSIYFAVSNLSLGGINTWGGVV